MDDGYNIYKDYQYLDSVKGKSSHLFSEAGHYDVVAFDDAGSFGAQYDNPLCRRAMDEGAWNVLRGAVTRLYLTLGAD